jgi:hypothetical protein
MAHLGKGRKSSTALQSRIGEDAQRGWVSITEYDVIGERSGNLQVSRSMLYAPCVRDAAEYSVDV